MRTALEKNSQYSDEYIQDISCKKIHSDVDNTLVSYKVKSIIDLGCGDGGFIFSIKKYFPEINISGIDISKRRIRGLKKRFSESKFFCCDVCNTGLREKFDFLYSNQVIEHVENDKLMIKEIGRLLKNGGLVYLSSVMKKPWAIYQYRNNRRFVLDPTHEREYKNSKEFLDLFKKDFRLIKFTKYPVVMPKWGLKVRIPGYYILEGIWQKR